MSGHWLAAIAVVSVVESCTLYLLPFCVIGDSFIVLSKIADLSVVKRGGICVS